MENGNIVGVCVNSNIQSFTEYMPHARSTALYTDTTRMPAISGLMYSALGMTNEFTEFLEAIADFSVRSDDWRHVLTEAGDVFWYCANILQDVGVNHLDFTPTDLPFFCDVDDIPFQDRFPKHIVIRATSAAGAVSGIVKKIYRDQDVSTLKEFPIAVDTQQQVDGIVGNIKQLLNCVSAFVFYSQRGHQFTTNELMQNIMTINIEKLYSRRDRGTLHGSGEDR